MTTANGHLSALDAALAYLHAGLCVIPIRADGSKAPTVKWEKYQGELPTEADLQQWYARGRFGVAVLGGAVSGMLECLDFDREAETIFPAWCELVAAECPGLVARLTVCRTPKPGYHVRYRCPEAIIPGDTDLAVDPAAPEKCRKLIETRGEGGYALAPGCPPKCNKASVETGRLYEHHSGPKLSQVGNVTAAEREVMIRCAVSFDRAAPAEEPTPTPNAGSGLRPGDDFNERGPSIRELVEAHGWTCMRESQARLYMRRPGKEEPGWSATIGCRSKAGHELFCVFSSSASPFPGPSGGKKCSSHNRFSVYALLNHGGDFSAAAKALAEQGYGEQRKKKGKAEDKAGDKNADSFTLEPLTLRIASARKTKLGRLTATVIVQRDGQAIDQLVLTSSATGRRDAVRRLAEHLGDTSEGKRSEIDRLLGRVLVAAEDKAGTPSEREGKLLREIVGPRLLADFKFVYRAGSVAYSETRGEVRRQDFITHAPSDLMEEAEEAADAPVNEQGVVVRAALAKCVQAEAGFTWSDVMRSLPLQADADLAADTKTAQEFRGLFERIWTTPAVWEQSSEGGARRVSLAKRALDQIVSQERSKRGRSGTRHWQPILDSVHAWWRTHVAPDGEYYRLLALRYDLAYQILKRDLPGVSDQESLTRLGIQFGVVDANPPINTRHMRGKERLALLSREVTERVLMFAGELADGREPGDDDAPPPEDDGRTADDDGQAASSRQQGDEPW